MGSKKRSTTTKQELSPQQQEIIGAATPVIKDKLANPPQQFPGSRVSPLNAQQIAGQNLALGTAVGPIANLYDQAASGHRNLQEEAIPSGTAGLQDLAQGSQKAEPIQDFLLSGDVLSPNNNPALRQHAQGAVDTLADSLTRKVLPSIRRGAQGAGQAGGSRQGIAEGNAINDFLDSAANTTSGIYSSAYGQGLGAATSGLGSTLQAATDSSRSLLSEGTRSLFAAPDLARLALLPSQVVGAVGSQNQEQSQNVLTDRAKQFQAQQLIQYEIALDAVRAASGLPGGTVQSNTR